MRKIRYGAFSCALLAVTALTVGPTASASEDPGHSSLGSSSGETNSYVLSDTYIYDGRVYGPEDGVEVHSGSVVLGKSNSSGSDMAALSTFNLGGGSYARSEERIQLYYDGSAYASGKRFSSIPRPKRVVEVCFKYTRDGKNLIGWQCSKASPGPGYYPGNVVRKTVRDSLNPTAPKTIFRYSYKTV